MLVNASYFAGDLDIPRTSNTDVARRLNKFIDKYEKEFLKHLLSDLLYADFIDAVYFQGVLLMDEFIEPQEWVNLKNLVEPLIAPYVYFNWMRDAAQQNTGVGVVESKAENATVVSGNWKMVRAWNEMVDGITEVYDYLDLNNSTYTNWNPRYRYYNLYFKPINTLGI